MNGSPVIHVVTDRRRVSPGAVTTREQLQAFERWIDEVIDAGPDVLQLRERDLDPRVLRDLAARAVTRAAGSPVRVLVNDRADVALAAGADGVHLRSDGPAPSRVRTLGPAGWIVGRSAHTLAEIGAYQDADYLLFGTVFPTRSKAAGSPVAGVEALAAVAAASAGPVIAIGGITEARAVQAIGAGASGVAGIGIFLPSGTEPSARGPARAVAALRAAMLE